MAIFDRDKHKKTINAAGIDLGRKRRRSTKPATPQSPEGGLPTPEEGQSEAETRQALERERDRREQLERTLEEMQEHVGATSIDEYDVVTVDPDDVQRRQWDTSPITTNNITQLYEDLCRTKKLLQAPILCQGYYPIAGQTRFLAIQRMKSERPGLYHEIFPDGVTVLMHKTVDFTRSEGAFRVLALKIQKQRRPIGGQSRNTHLIDTYQKAMEERLYSSAHEAAIDLAPLYGLQKRRAYDIILGKAKRDAGHQGQTVKRCRASINDLLKYAAQHEELRPFMQQLQPILEEMRPVVERMAKDLQGSGNTQ